MGRRPKNAEGQPDLTGGFQKHDQVKVVLKVHPMFGQIGTIVDIDIDKKAPVLPLQVHFGVKGAKKDWKEFWFEADELEKT